MTFTCVSLQDWPDEHSNGKCTHFQRYDSDISDDWFGLVCSCMRQPLGPVLQVISRCFDRVDQHGASAQPAHSALPALRSGAVDPAVPWWSATFGSVSALPRWFPARRKFRLQLDFPIQLRLIQSDWIIFIQCYRIGDLLKRLTYLFPTHRRLDLFKRFTDCVIPAISKYQLP